MLKTLTPPLQWQTLFGPVLLLHPEDGNNGCDYRAGYRRSDAFKGQWTIHVGLKDAAEKGRVKAKTVIFTDDRLTKLADGELQLYRRPF